jgi:NitT/TauT family transport system substrate-binding protein
MKLTSSRIAVALLLFGLVSTTISCRRNRAATQSQTEKLTFQLHWIPDTHQLGFWTALDKGFYRQHRLDVTIHPGGLDANPLKDALSGAADVGQVGGIEQVCTAVSEGLPLKAIAAIHRETPHALISLSTDPIEEPAAFKGKTIAVAFGDTAEILLKSYMAQAGIPESSVKLVPFKFDLTPLLSGRVDAITGFSTGQPATIEKLGRKPVVLRYSSAGVSSYGYTLVTSERTLAARKDAIRNFLSASREGWKYAFAHPDEAITLFKKRFGDSVDEQQSRRELELIKPLMVQAGALATWKFDEKRVAGVLKFLRERGQVKKEIPASLVFDGSYTE